eukprot:1768605-Rhodomonas_salina.1
MAHQKLGERRDAALALLLLCSSLACFQLACASCAGSRVSGSACCCARARDDGERRMMKE